ncbi:MAG: hypothetical protein L7S63_04735 [Flavobacteriales bacterium]|nr:hypothetical protein [Flavobacteriales bacterium]
MNTGFGFISASLSLSAFPKRSRHACTAKILCCLLLLGGSVTSALSQDSLLTAPPLRSGAPLVKKAGSTIGFKGFYRFLGYVRAQDETFPNNSGKTTAILVGDAYREPMLLLNMMGRTQEGIGFGADLMINSVYKGSSDAFTQPLTLNLGLNLRASFKTDHGDFTVRSGGVSWYRQSRLTVWGNQAFNRFSLFERRPGTPLTPTPVGRYGSYYRNGLIDEGVRYGARAFQGIFLQGSNLPGGLRVKGVIGKSGFNRSYLTQSDNYTGCFQWRKDVSDSLWIAYNLLASHADVDSLTTVSRSYSIHTLELQHKSDQWTVHLEAGLGRYNGPDYELGAGEAVVLTVKPGKKSRLPLHFQAYRISPQFVNVTGNFLNTTVLEVFPNVGGVNTTVRTPYRSPMTGLGAPVNNRQGLSINGDVSVGSLKINGGIGAFAEIDTSRAGVSYIHQVNGQLLSRIYLFGQNWGPYNALNSMYRGVFEDVDILDTNATGMAGFKKFFSTAELQAKLKTQWGGKEVYLFSLSRLNSCQRSLRALPVLGPDAVVSQFTQEFDASIAVSEEANVILSYGIERVIGNEDTNLGDAGVTSSTSAVFEWLGAESLYGYNAQRNQRNRMIGMGLDYKVGERAMLFVRHSRYRYFDPNFIENHLTGSETMLELKMMF